jgi:hypothetical protein
MTSTTVAKVVALAAETEQHRDIPASPVVWGVVAFSILMFLLLCVLAFGRGRT